MTALSAVIGMVVGAVTVVVWSNLSGGLFELYEIVPWLSVCFTLDSIYKSLEGRAKRVNIESI